MLTKFMDWLYNLLPEEYGHECSICGKRYKTHLGSSVCREIHAANARRQTEE